MLLAEGTIFVAQPAVFIAQPVVLGRKVVVPVDARMRQLSPHDNVGAGIGECVKQAGFVGDQRLDR
jgi:hypothetical protein